MHPRKTPIEGKVFRRGSEIFRAGSGSPFPRPAGAQDHYFCLTGGCAALAPGLYPAALRALRGGGWLRMGGATTENGVCRNMVWCRGLNLRHGRDWNGGGGGGKLVAGLARTAQRAVPTIGKVWGEGQSAGLAVRARDGLWWRRPSDDVAPDGAWNLLGLFSTQMPRLRRWRGMMQLLQTWVAAGGLPGVAAGAATPGWVIQFLWNWFGVGGRCTPGKRRLRGRCFGGARKFFGQVGGVHSRAPPGRKIIIFAWPGAALRWPPANIRRPSGPCTEGDGSEWAEQQRENGVCRNMVWCRGLNLRQWSVWIGYVDAVMIRRQWIAGG